MRNTKRNLPKTYKRMINFTSGNQEIHKAMNSSKLDVFRYRRTYYSIPYLYREIINI